jgi:UDP-N-acetylglucosamine:LPS N-acetylglucosamine transferase
VKPLADVGAAIIVDDIPTNCVETTKQITEHILGLMKDEEKRKEMSEASKQLAMPRAAEHIAQNILELIG